jgi:hypothetical protein
VRAEFNWGCVREEEVCQAGGKEVVRSVIPAAEATAFITQQNLMAFLLAYCY